MIYLECSSHAVDAVIGFLSWQTLERKLYGVVLLWDQIIRPVHPFESAPCPPKPLKPYDCSLPAHRGGWIAYLNPNLRYPAASKYQFDSGFIQRYSQGRLDICFASEGVDMSAVGGGGVEMYFRLAVSGDARLLLQVEAGRGSCRFSIREPELPASSELVSSLRGNMEAAEGNGRPHTTPLEPLSIGSNTDLRPPEDTPRP